MSMKKGKIYKITNTENGLIYIGCTIDWKRRFSEYRRLSMVGQKKLYNSLKKYGYENPYAVMRSVDVFVSQGRF
mgnify:CR=1 FL=1